MSNPKLLDIRMGNSSAANEINTRLVETVVTCWRAKSKPMTEKSRPSSLERTVEVTKGSRYQ